MTYDNCRRGRRIKIGDRLIYKGDAMDHVRYGKVTPGEIYTSIGRRGDRIYIENSTGAEISFIYTAFDFADK